jgi:hypothetical protein
VRFARVVTWLGLLSLASQLVAVLAGAILDPTWTILSGALVVGGSWVRAIPARRDRLEGTVAIWLADERPAWETVEAFERDVERVMRGDQTQDYVERMPLRPPRKPTDYARGTRRLTLDELDEQIDAVVRCPADLHRAHALSGLPPLDPTNRTRG